jgi:predicted HTH domain antitoxin
MRYFKELALALYAPEILSFGKARELANLDHWQFSQLLSEYLLVS